MAASLAIVLKSLFSVLGCLLTATVIYTLATDGLPFRKELLTPWMTATLIDFYIHVFVIGSWVVYKESNWITAILWAVLLVCLGSITTCGYIVLQFLKLSTQESLQDPIYFVLLRRQKKTETEQQRKCSLLTARILSLALGCLMLGTLIYTIVTDGSPFRRDVFTPWLSATVIDLYVNIVVLSVWVAYKESSWLSAAFWIILIICVGSISTCAYIFLQLFSLSSQDPVYLVLFSSRKRDYVLCAIKKRTTILLDNLEQETTTFLNFQESTNCDEPLQGVLNAGDYTQRNPTSELDSLDQLHPLIEKRTTMLLDNNNLEVETTAFLNFQESALEWTSYVYDELLPGVVIKPGDYMERNSEPELDALQFHPLTEKNLEELGVMLHYMREDEDLNITIEPLLAPYTFEAASMSWHNILLDSNDIDQILQGI